MYVETNNTESIIAPLPVVDCDGSDRTELAALASCIPLPEIRPTILSIPSFSG